jgi:hypothetical protein
MSKKIRKCANIAAVLWAVIAFMSFLVQPVAARSLDAIIASGEIRVGVNPEYPPTSKYDSKNELVGFDIDLTNKIAAMLGVKPVFVVVSASSRVPFVASGKVDYVMGAMTRTTERAKLIDFTLPINTESMGVLTLAGKPFNTPADLNKPGVTIAEVRGTTGAKLAAAKFPQAKLLELDNHPDVLRAVAQGRADAVVEVIPRPDHGHSESQLAHAERAGRRCLLQRIGCGKGGHYPAQLVERRYLRTQSKWRDGGDVAQVVWRRHARTGSRESSVLEVLVEAPTPKGWRRSRN